MATGRQGGTRLARSIRPDPVHQLRRRWGQRLTVLASGPPPSRNSQGACLPCRARRRVEARDTTVAGVA